MRTAGLPLNDVWADRVLREHGIASQRVDQVASTVSVFVESMTLGDHGPVSKHRPYLHIHGELRQITVSESLPGGVTQISFSPGQGESIDAYYEFDDEQVARLVLQGFHDPQFAVAPGTVRTVWDFPAVIDTLVVAPGVDDTHLGPIIFVNVHDAGDLRCDQASCGHDFVDCFVDLSVQGAQVDTRQATEQMVAAAEQAITPLFMDNELVGDVDYVEPDFSPVMNTLAPVNVEAVAGDDDLAEQLRAAQDAMEIEKQLHRASLETKSGTIENLYKQWVAPVFESESQTTTVVDKPASVVPTTATPAKESFWSTFTPITDDSDFEFGD